MKTLVLLFYYFLILSNEYCKSASLLEQTDERGENFYRFSYTLDDGTSRFEEGILKEVDGVKFYEVTGFYKYRTENGKEHKVDYSADPQHGYQASTSVSDGIPFVGIAPSIDNALIKSLLG